MMPVFFLSTGLRTNWSVGGEAVFVAAGLLLIASVAGKLIGEWPVDGLARAVEQGFTAAFSRHQRLLDHPARFGVARREAADID